MSKRVFFPYLDSLRFLAFFIVFISHIYRDFQFPGHDILSKIVNFGLSMIFIGGKEGVHIFFVLSGFLITFLLIEEAKETGTINVLHFYLRRALRIWPLYYLILFLGLFVLPQFLPETFPADQSKLLALTFLVNFDAGVFTPTRWNPAFSVAWSVAIEEQFYLVFPLYFLLLYSNFRRYYLITLSVILCSFTLYFCYDRFFPFYTLYSICFLMIGSLGAYMINFDNDRIGLIPFAKKYDIYILITSILLFAFSEVLLRKALGSFNISYVWHIILGLLYLLLIVRICFGAPFKWKIFNLTNRLGMYSYGLYFYHQMILYLIRACFEKAHINFEKNFLLLSIIAVLAFVVTVMVSYLSYTYYEKFFLGFKNKFAAILSGNQ